MPTAQQQQTGFDARRFAALLAGFDTGNACEAEALGKGRALRRMAALANTRIVDLMEVPEVKQAIDDQMQPVRKQTADLQMALEQAAALREELTERTRNVRKMAELLTRQKEETEGLRSELAAAKFAASQAPAWNRPSSPAPASAANVSGATAHSFGAQSWFFEVAVAAVVLVVLVMSVFSGTFLERSNADELGIDEGNSPIVVRKDGAVLPVPKLRVVPHRVRRSGRTAGTE